jgi:hypothetical protein
MPIRRESKQDSFDQWVKHVLTVSVADAQPSEQVWQRIATAVTHSTPPNEIWPARRGESRLFVPELPWLERRDRSGGMQLANMVISLWWLYRKPLVYA